MTQKPPKTVELKNFKLLIKRTEQQLYENANAFLQKWVKNEWKLYFDQNKVWFWVQFDPSVLQTVSKKRK